MRVEGLGWRVQGLGWKVWGLKGEGSCLERERRMPIVAPDDWIKPVKAVDTTIASHLRQGCVFGWEVITDRSCRQIVSRQVIKPVLITRTTG